MRWLTECGNGIVEGEEQCDDGNLAGGDGCSAVCKVSIPARASLVGAPGILSTLQCPGAFVYWQAAEISQRSLSGGVGVLVMRPESHGQTFANSQALGRGACLV